MGFIRTEQRLVRKSLRIQKINFQRRRLEGPNHK